MRAFLSIAVALCLAAISANAASSTLIVGSPMDDTGFCVPFGCSFQGEFQQNYSASWFTPLGPITVTALTFYSTAFPTGASSMNSGNWTISLSVTSVEPRAISKTLASNITGTPVQVFSGDLQQPWYSGKTLTIPLATPYTYDPAQGNLLMDVVASGTTGTSVSFDLMRDRAGISIACNPGSACSNTGTLPYYGLVTGFTYNVTAPNGRQLVWSDEFNGPAGTAPSSTKWNFDLGNNGGWDNGEIESYTNSIDNAFEDGNGNLVIRAIKDAQGNYTSARLHTGDVTSNPAISTHTANLTWQYGRIDARIKVPFGHGVWPAFRMFGANYGTAGWPLCGEIDVMDNFGYYLDSAGALVDASTNNGAAQGPGYTGFSGGEALWARYKMPLGQTTFDDYHVYSLEWSADSIAWYVDGTLYHMVLPGDLKASQTWVFNQPFFLLLDLAIGGTIPGAPDDSVTFPKDMLVDYVRIYQPVAVPTTTPIITPGRVVNAASYLGTLAPGTLAAVYGNHLAADVQLLQKPDGSFPTTANDITVTVNGVPAALVFVSPGQINFQIPWETATGAYVPVKVTRNGSDSNIEYVTVTPVAPSMFLSEFDHGLAWVTGNTSDGCATLISECRVKAGSTYELWANGLGPKRLPEHDGIPDGATTLDDLSVAGGTASCQLTIGGIPATVVYCGAAPGEIIDQLNFTYPDGVTSDYDYTDAALTINGVTGHVRVPAP